MFIFQIIFWMIVVNVINGISNKILNKVLIPKKESRFNRISNYVPNLISYLVLGLMLGEEYSKSTILMGIILIEIVRFIFKVIGYKYIEITDDGKVLLNNIEVKLNESQLDFFYKINPSYIMENKTSDNDLDVATIVMTLVVNGKAFSYIEYDILKGTEVLNKLNKNYNLVYVYNGKKFFEPHIMLLDIADNIKKQIDFYIAKKGSSNKNMILNKYSERISKIAKNLNISDEEIKEIVSKFK